MAADTSRMESFQHWKNVACDQQTFGSPFCRGLALGDATRHTSTQKIKKELSICQSLFCLASNTRGCLHWFSMNDSLPIKRKARCLAGVSVVERLTTGSTLAEGVPCAS